MGLVQQFTRLLPVSVARSRIIFASTSSTKTFLKPCLFFPQNVCVRHCAAYEGTGKTTITFMNEDQNYLMVDAYSARGFTLNNGMKVIGPMVLFPNAVLSWRVQGIRDLHNDSLILFRLLDPRPEVIFVGYGDRTLLHEPENPIGKEIRKQNIDKISQISITMRRHGLNVECLPTEDAIGNYNYLCTEDRLVAAALIPPDRIRFISSDHQMSKEAYSSTRRKKDMFTDEKFLKSD